MSVCGADSCLFVDKKMINEGGNFVYILLKFPTPSYQLFE